MKKILISGYYGYFNSGDDAILTSICKDIREISLEHEITILSNNPPSTRLEYGVAAVEKFNFIKVIKAIIKSDIVLMGGGSLLQDETSNRSLYYYLFILWFAKISRKKIMLYANGIGPIGHRFNRFLTKLVVNQVDIITLRERMSQSELKHMGIDRPEIYVTADPVFSFPPLDVHIDEILKEAHIEKDDKLVGVLFREWKNSHHCSRKIAEICDYLSTSYGAKIILIPMKHPADLVTCEAISSYMENEAVILRHKYDAKTLIEIMGEMTLVLSMRLHALLYAALKDVPMIGFSYSHKVRYYMKELDQPYIEDVTDFETEEVKVILNEIFDHYEDIREKIHEKVTEMRLKADQNKMLLEKIMTL
ncbi:MAG: polysaccharide pyruvyl transferase CsaB [Vallitaleaceae bacterium]|nr:polysaccharide pyruvyl transferase CsaB [Vallitaleaceae bacterium]